MKKTYTKKFILEAIAYWKKQLRQLNEGISFEGAESQAIMIRDNIEENVATADELFAWANDDTLVITDSYGNELYSYCLTNLDKVKRYVKEIEWEHGDIDDEALKYEDYFRAMIDAVETKDKAAADRWLNSPLP